MKLNAALFGIFLPLYCIATVTLTVTIGGDAYSETGGSVDTSDPSGLSGDLRYCFNRISDQSAQGIVPFSTTNAIAVVFDPSISSISLNNKLPIPNLIVSGSLSDLTIGNSSSSNTVTISNASGINAGGIYIASPQGGPTLSNITLQNLTFNGCSNQGGNGGTSGGGGGGLGAGGALFIDSANVSLLNVNFTNNQAIGGKGSSGTDGYAGGGGLGGDGGSFYGGGGGGYSGNGGNGDYNGGNGGGGGGLANGGNASTGENGAGGGGGGAVLGATGGNGGDASNIGENGDSVTPQGASTPISFGGGGGGGGSATLPGNGGGLNGGSGAGFNSGGGGGGGSFGSSSSGTSGAAGGSGGGGGGSGCSNSGSGGNGGAGAGGGGVAGQGATPGGVGGTGGYGGGAGGLFSNGGFGGGGSSGFGSGGFGGGGGGNGNGFPGGTGGFGAGSSGGSTSSSNIGGTAGSVSGGTTFGGDGAGFGGAIFVYNNATLSIHLSSTFSNNSTGQQSGGQGASFGNDIFLSQNSSVDFIPGSGQTITVSGSISDDSLNSVPSGHAWTPGSGSGGSITISGPGTTRLLGANTYANQTYLDGGILSCENNSAIGSNALQMSSTTTLALTDGISLPNEIVFVSGVGTASFSTSSGTGTLSGVISGAGVEFNKIGAGALTLSNANTYSGTTLLSEGKLTINGSIAGPLTSLAGTTLKGTGTIHGTATINGTLSPGNSIGSIQFGTGLNLGSSSTTQLEISPTQGSKVNVTGNASLDGSLVILPDGTAHYPAGTTYVLLQTTGSVSGTFSSYTIPPVFLSQLLYLSNEVVLEILHHVQFDLSNFSGNNLIVARYLHTQPLSFLTNPAFIELTDLPPSEQNQAFEAIDPLRQTHATWVVDNNAFLLSDQLSNRLGLHRQMRDIRHEDLLAALLTKEGKNLIAMSKNMFRSYRCPEDAQSHKPKKERTPDTYHLWATGFGSFIHQDGQNQTPAFLATTEGVLGGFDYSDFEHGLIGCSAAYLPTQLKEHHHLGENKIQSGYIAFYGAYTTYVFFLEGALWGGYQHIQSNRKIIYSGFDKTAHSTHNGWQVTPHVKFGLHRSGYDFWEGTGAFEPFVSFDFANEWERGYKEQGASPYNMQIPKRYSSMLQTEAGISCLWNRKFLDGILFLNGKISYINKSPFSTGSLTAALVGSPSNFFVTTFTQSQNLGSAAVDITWKDLKSRYAALSYSGEFGNGAAFNTITGRLGKSF